MGRLGTGNRRPPISSRLILRQEWSVPDFRGAATDRLPCSPGRKERPLRILLTGATGFIGSAIGRRLVAAGHTVVGVARRPPPATPSHSWLALDFMTHTTPESWISALDGVDVVVNAVGIIRERGGCTFEALHAQAPIALFDACAAQGVSRVVQISAAGVDRGGTAYRTTKARADAHLMTLEAQNPVILRPSLVFGDAGQSARLFRTMASAPIIPLVGDGRFALRPVFVDDVAEAVVRAVAGRAASGIYPVGGEEEHTLASMMRAYRDWLGGRGPLVSVPLPIMRFTARLGDLTGRGAIDSAELTMLMDGAADDITPFVDAFGFTPGGLAAHLQAHPSTQADRWQGRFLLLRVPIRLLVASIWLLTPIVSLISRDESLALLEASGFGGAMAVPLLWAACLLEFAMAGALIAGRQVRLVGVFSIVLMLGYTAILTATTPELWLDPFGSLSKNLPLIGATLAMIATDE